jgi:hypothetical protein
VLNGIGCNLRPHALRGSRREYRYRRVSWRTGGEHRDSPQKYTIHRTDSVAS